MSGLAILIGCLISSSVSRSALDQTGNFESIRFSFFSFHLIQYAYEVSLVRSNMAVGSRGVWDDETNSLYFVDLFGGSFARYDYLTDQVYKANVTGRTGFVGVVTPIKGQKGSFYVASGGDIFTAQWDGISPTATAGATLATVDPAMVVNSFLVTPDNDVFIGGFGDAFCASTSDFSLFEYTRDGKVKDVADGFIATVGLAMDEEKNVVYQLDPCTYKLVAYDYTPSTGRLCECQDVHLF